MHVLPRRLRTAPLRNCPRCGASLDRSAAGEEPAEGLGASNKRSSLSSAVIAVIALAVLAGAGAVIYQNVSALLPEKGLAGVMAGLTHAAPKPALRDANSPQAQDEAKKDEGASWTHSRMVVARAGREAGNRPVVVLGHPSGVTKPGQLAGIQKGLLARELVRQAVLLAARDELGLATRDEELGDALPGGQGNVSADVAALLRVQGAASVNIGRDEGGKTRLLLECDFLSPAPVHDLVEIARAAEGLSRTEFPKALRVLGLEGKPNAVRPVGEVPGSVENRLASLGFVEPLIAVRDLHAAIRNDGESPARLGALIRGYARLGVLNEHLWSPAHKVFKARALLYAQRLICATRNRLGASGTEPTSRRWWVCTRRPLMTWPRRRNWPWARLPRRPPRGPTRSRPTAISTSRGSRTLRGRRRSSRPCCGCLRWSSLTIVTSPCAVPRSCCARSGMLSAHDVMYKVGGVSNLHVATMLAPQILTEIVPRRIRAIDTLPESVRVPIDRNAGEVALVDALERAGRPEEDSGEPSWAVLGYLIRETRFVQVQHRLYFMRYWWSVPVEEFWDEARPLVAGHRYQPYLLTLALGTPQADRAFADSFGEALLPDLEFTEKPMSEKLLQISKQKHNVAWKLIQQHMDHLVKDFATQCDIYTNEHKELWIHNANKVLGLSPDNPYAMSLLVEVDGENVQPRLAEWEKKGTEFPPLAGALGRRYSELRAV